MKLFIVLCVVFLSLFSFIVTAQTCNDGEERDCGFSGAGECVLGTQTCFSGVWGQCFGAVYPEDEVCADDLDNDCDGLVDEECVCVDGETRECGSEEIGICLKGIETCLNNAFGDCTGAVLPKMTDLCGSEGQGNGLDDDCDGVVDEKCVVGNVTVLSPSVTCFDKKLNYGEIDVDCGGPCVACIIDVESCEDGVLNQDEEGVDCGGVCEVCFSCEDGMLNQDEEGVDCGGSCDECSDDEIDFDNDGLTKSEELLMGTSDKHFDTDGDGLGDAEDKMPLCPNSFCNVALGETAELCPQDCEEEKETPLLFILILLLILFLFALFVYHKVKKTGKVSRFSGLKKQVEQPSFDVERFTALQQRKSRSKKEKDEVEESFKKVEKILKK